MKSGEKHRDAPARNTSSRLAVRRKSHQDLVATWPYEARSPTRADRVMEMQSQIDSVESYVQKNLDF